MFVDTAVIYCITSLREPTFVPNYCIKSRTRTSPSPSPIHSRNIVIEAAATNPEFTVVKYSQFGAILLTTISSSGENSVAPLCGLTETAVWRHCLRPKKAPLGTFRRKEKCFKGVIIHERPTNVSILQAF